MNYNLVTELNQLLLEVFTGVEGRAITSELFDELAEVLNKQVNELYSKFGYKINTVIDRDFVIHMFNLLVESGGIEVRSADKESTVYSHFSDIKPSDPTAHHPALLDDANEYDPVAAEFEEPAQKGPIDIWNTLWLQIVNNRQFIEAEADMAGISALTVANVGSPDHTKEVAFPDGWGENLMGNFDGSHWAKEFKVLLDLQPGWAKDEGYLTGWFANAIMTGYDRAKQEEFPTAERGANDYVYVEFYDVTHDEWAPRSAEQSEITFKFHTLAAAKEFVKLNAFGENFKSKYYRFYQLEPTTTYTKTEIK